MEKVLINGYPCLKGDDPDSSIEKLSYRDLHVNDKVLSIGRKNSGIESKLTFDYPATYKGIYSDKDDQYIVFHIDQRDVIGRDLFNNPSLVCILIAISEDVLYLQNHHDMTTKEIKPIFYKER